MKFVYMFFVSIALAILCSCTIFNTNQTHPDSSAPDVGKNWQIIEQPPQLSNERGRLPFQMEQSVQPGVAKPLPPVEKRMIDSAQSTATAGDVAKRGEGDVSVENGQAVK